MAAAPRNAAAGDEILAIFARFLEATRAAARKRRQAPFEERYRKLIVRRFRRQGKWFLDKVLVQVRGQALREADGDHVPTAAEILEAISKLLRQVDDYPEDADTLEKLDATLRLALLAGAKEVMLNIRPGTAIKFNLENARALAWLKENAFSKVKDGIDATTKAALKSILEDGLASGLSYSKVASLIREKFGDMTRDRATRIAVNEIGNAFSEGTLSTAHELQDHGIEMEKSWLTAGDDAVEEDCAENEDAGWIGIDEDFPSGDDRPLAHVNCRCALEVRVVPAGEEEPADEPVLA